MQALWGRPRAAAVEPQQPACCRAAKAAPGTPPIAPPLPAPPIAPPLPPAVAATAVHHRCRDPQPSLPPCRDRPPWVRASIAASTTAAKWTTSLLTTTRRRGAQPRAALSRGAPSPPALTRAICCTGSNLLPWGAIKCPLAMNCTGRGAPSAIHCPQCNTLPPVQYIAPSAAPILTLAERAGVSPPRHHPAPSAGP